REAAAHSSHRRALDGVVKAQLSAPERLVAEGVEPERVASLGDGRAGGVRHVVETAGACRGVVAPLQDCDGGRHESQEHEDGAERRTRSRTSEHGLSPRVTRVLSQNGCRMVRIFRAGLLPRCGWSSLKKAL